MDNSAVGDQEVELELAGDERWRLRLRPNLWPAFRRLQLRRSGAATMVGSCNGCGNGIRPASPNAAAVNTA
jgi:hypothetical protein